MTCELQHPPSAAAVAVVAAARRPRPGVSPLPADESSRSTEEDAQTVETPPWWSGLLILGGRADALPTC